MKNKLLAVIAINLSILTGLMILQAVPTGFTPIPRTVELSSISFV